MLYAAIIWRYSNLCGRKFTNESHEINLQKYSILGQFTLFFLMSIASSPVCLDVIVFLVWFDFSIYYFIIMMNSKRSTLSTLIGLQHDDAC